MSVQGSWAPAGRLLQQMQGHLGSLHEGLGQALSPWEHGGRMAVLYGSPTWVFKCGEGQGSSVRFRASILHKPDNREVGSWAPTRQHGQSPPWPGPGGKQ
jgi:hypothetical protein